MAKVRSPVLGFNHNIRHRGWLFHVQTEDSGVANPHIFTHLFHDGVIIATKKMVYDANSDVDVVKSLMQAQHKSVLKGLKSGEYDVKIKKYLGDAPEGGETTPPPPETPRDSTAPVASASIPPVPTSVPDDDPDRLDLPRLAMPMPDTWRQSVPDGSVGGAVPADASAADTLPRGSGPTEEQKHARATGDHPALAADSASPPADQATQPAEMPSSARSSGSWVVTRPGQKERPFEKVGASPDDTGSGRSRPLTPPIRSVDDLPETPAFTPRPKQRPSNPGDARREPSSPGDARRETSPPPPGDARREPSSPGDARRTPSAPPRPMMRPSRPPGKSDSTPPGRPAPVAERRTPSQPERRGTPAAGVPSTGGQPRPTPPVRPAVPKPPEPSSVVVARPAVVIGAPPTVIGGNPQQNAARRVQHARESINNQTADNIFGQDLISEKSLDEVIMAYLSEDSNDE